MADSYEKRARERRKQKKRLEKAERRRGRNVPEDEGGTPVGPEPNEEDWFGGARRDAENGRESSTR